MAKPYLDKDYISHAQIDFNAMINPIIIYKLADNKIQGQISHRSEGIDK